MGFFDRLINARAEQRATAIADPGVPLTSTVLLDALNIGKAGTAGQQVNEESALGLTAYWRAVTLKAGLLATSPVVVKRLADRQVVDSKLLRSPHPLYTRFEWYELMSTLLELHGDAIGVYERNGGVGSIKAIMPLNPKNVIVNGVYDKRGALVDRVYEVYSSAAARAAKDAAKRVILPSEEVFHVMGPTKDGLRGMSQIKVHAEAMGTAIATDKYAGKLFGSGSLMSGILTTDKRLTPDQAEAIRQRWRQKMTGLSSAHDVAILDNGAKFESLSIPPEDAQFIQARKYGVAEIARITGVPTKLLMETEGGGTSNPEHDGLEFVRFTMATLGGRFSARFTADLLPSSQEAEFDFGRLAEPDVRTRSSAALMWRNAKVKSVNEIRADEGLPRIEEDWADDPSWEPESAAAVGDGADPGDNQDQPDAPAPDDQVPTEDIDT